MNHPLDHLRVDAESPFDQLRTVRENGAEFWSARELMPLLGYKAWQKFSGSIDRAKMAAANQGYDIGREFAQVVGVIASDNPSGTERLDYELSRFACYLVAMNGDPRKPEVSAAQAYFAVRTREAETASTRELTPTELALMVIESERQKVLAQRELAVLVPKAQRYERWLESADTMYVEEWGKVLGMTRPEAFDHLRATGVLSRRAPTDGRGGHLNVPNKGFESLFELRYEMLPTGERALVPRITPRGAVILAERLVRAGRLDPKALGYLPRPQLPEELDL